MSWDIKKFCTRCRRVLVEKQSKELGMCGYCRSVTNSTERLIREKAENEERQRQEEIEQDEELQKRKKEAQKAKYAQMVRENFK